MRILKSLLFLLLGLGLTTEAQNKNTNAVYVDKSGVLRWTKTNREAAFFGVNYTAPFAYGYRAQKTLNNDLEKAIDADVYHLARLGLDAFRVHVWDTEISDSLGNLKENEHLRLFDYLLFKLKARGIKILLTPLAFWGNGYPEPDEKTGSFSSIWNKQQVLVTEAAIKAQENYLHQLLKHTNPYTKKTYGADEDVLALEINNEPHHTGTKKVAADYIARMVAAVKSSGWTKPVVYNISESPTYADVVANANIDGVSFQWYPTGLVSGHTLQGNYLPNVDVYAIPFDTILSYKNKARFVYEFDAGDVLQSNMYPAMARSFRAAGFQWATQFAYDPMATAYANTEYQTHYLNLAYTPAKAISLLIAAKAFHQLPRGQSYGTYPADSVFKNFRVSYANALSEMNSDTAFYYSNTTVTTPVAFNKLQHVAGVGNSPIIHYNGNGAYFLDKVSEGVWRLEVMPDALFIRDPFEKAFLQKEVTRIEWNRRTITINLPGVVPNFFVAPLNSGNHFTTQAAAKTFDITPGTYIITNTNGHGDLKKFVAGFVGITEFEAPPATKHDVFINTITPQAISAAQPFTLTATVAGVTETSVVSVEVQPDAGAWKTITMQHAGASIYSAVIPIDMLQPGILHYRILVRQQDGSVTTFPGAHTGDPFAWDYFYNDRYEVFVMPKDAPIALFTATQDRTNLQLFVPDWRNNTIRFTTTTEPGALALQLTANKPLPQQVMGFQTFIGDKIKARAADAASLNALVLKAVSSQPQTIILTLVTKSGAAFAQTVMVDTVEKNMVLPLSLFKQDKMLLLPRPYPGFMPLYFTAGGLQTLTVSDLDKLQVSFAPAENAKPVSVSITSIVLTHSSQVINIE